MVPGGGRYWALLAPKEKKKYLDNVSIWFIELILSVDPFGPF
jgi:hypothetical protein